MLTRFYFRDTDLENAHATYSDEILTHDFINYLLDDPSQQLAEWIIMRDDLLKTSPTLYYLILKSCELIKSLDDWDQEPILANNGKPINVDLFNYGEYDIDALKDNLTNSH